jgi:hypothetical protein
MFPWCNIRANRPPSRAVHLWFIKLFDWKGIKTLFFAFDYIMPFGKAFPEYIISKLYAPRMACNVAVVFAMIIA